MNKDKRIKSLEQELAAAQKIILQQAGELDARLQWREELTAERGKRMVAEQRAVEWHEKYMVALSTPQTVKTIYLCPKCGSIGHSKPGPHCNGVESGTTEDF